MSNHLIRINTHFRYSTILSYHHNLFANYRHVATIYKQPERTWEIRMQKENHSFSYLLLGAAVALICSPLPAILATTTSVANDTKTGLFALSMSLLLFGIGEVLNHPAHSGNRYTRDGDIGRFVRLHQRMRIPCALGNLMFIISLLLMFIGLGKIIFS